MVQVYCSACQPRRHRGGRGRPLTRIDVACRKHRWNARVTPKMLYGKERTK